MSRKLRFFTLDVFTDRRFCGNPLAVYTDAEGIADAQMQQIAREMNLSETVFILPAQDPKALCRARIFTPARELPFAGHPTIGTGFLLAALNRVTLNDGRASILLEEKVGLVPISIESRGAKPAFVQLSVAELPSYRDPPAGRDELARMLRLKAEDLIDDAQAVSCGLQFLFVPVHDRSMLARAGIDAERWERTLSSYSSQQVFIFCRDPELAGSSIRARMFSPTFGIAEDPATGSAAAALGGYLGARAPEGDGTLRWIVEQGFEMGRPSLLHVETDKSGGRITGVRVGGTAVLVSEGTLEVD